MESGKEKTSEELLEELDIDKEDDGDTAEKSEIDEDYVDELFLKDQEVGLSDDQLLVRKNDAAALKAEGNKLFSSGDYENACKQYSSALRLCPLKYENDRSVLYANRGACYMKRSLRAQGIEDCNKAIELDENYMKAFLRRATMYEEEDKLDEALEDYKKVFELDRTNKQAAEAIATLPARINEKNEKLKEQMLGTLKDLGNKILRPFGLSTENFKLQQDPSSGGYTINFQQNQQ